MTPTPPNPKWPGMLMAFGMGTLGHGSLDATRAVPQPTGLFAQPTSGIPLQYVRLSSAAVPTRAERVRALRGRFKGLGFSVEEFLREKRLDTD